MLTTVPFTLPSRINLRQSVTQALIRNSLIWAAESRSFFFTTYISTKDNDLADNLSRLNVQRFRALAADRGIVVDDLPSKLVFATW